MKRIEINIYQLCDEIDDLKEEVAYWKKAYENERDINIATTNERFEESKKGIANALKFMLAVKDDENGNLVINSADRKELATNWK